jgi:hypothetical protein
MNIPNVLLIHIKCQILHARVQIYHPPHDYGIMFNIQQNFITLKNIKFEPHVQVCVQFINLPMTHFRCCRKITDENVLQLDELNQIMD